MTTLVVPKVVACLGDSLTLGADTNLHVWTARVDIASTVFPQASTGNFGVSGNTIAQMQTRYTQAIKAAGYSAVVLQGFINDILADTSATTIWTAANALITEILADGIPVILVITSPFGNYTGFTAPRQVQLLALRTLMLARTGVTIVDCYAAFGSAADSTKMDLTLDYGDGLHWDKDGAILAASLIAPKVAALFPTAAAAAASTLNTFGVTPAIMKADYFPHNNEFTTDANPTLAAVTRFIDQEAAVLKAKLQQESITATAITVATDAPYLWCQATLTLMAAIHTMPKMTQQDSALLKTWREELEARWADLDENGYLAIGTGTGVSAPTTQPDGPTHFVDTLGLDVSENNENASGITARLRRDDDL